MIILIKSGSPEVYIIAGIVTWAYKWYIWQKIYANCTTSCFIS